MILRRDRRSDGGVAPVAAVPAADGVGDDVMAALVLRQGTSFDGAAFDAFLEAQPDLARAGP